MNKEAEIKEAAHRFIEYIKMGWDIQESFEIAYDSVYDIIDKEYFLRICQLSCVTEKLSILN